MLLNRFKILLILCSFALASPSLFSQKVGFIDSETIRQEFEEVEQAEQLIQTIIAEWKLELKAMQEQINNLEKDIYKNRLVWSEETIGKKKAYLETLVKKKRDYSNEKFRPGGEFDRVVERIQKPIEKEIFKKYQEKSDE
jgi:outer membrane protein